ncbi:MAG: hypothetical protein ACRCYY_09595 [Trueperaceae bacterium]
MKSIFTSSFLRLLVFVSLFAGYSPSFSSAQTLGFGVAFNTEARLEPELTLSDFDFPKFDLELRLAGLISGPLEFGVKMRQDRSSGPLGNAMVQAHYDFSSEGQTQFLLEARGVFGPISASAGWQIFNTLPGTFNLDEAFRDIRPRLEGTGMVFDLGVSYRLSRTLIVSAAPSLYTVADQGLAFRLNADLKFAKLFNPNDASIVVLGYSAPNNETSFAAIGFEIDVNERTLPPMVASVWVGAGTEGVAPGVRGSFRQTIPELNAQYGAELGLEPYRTDTMPYRLSSFYEQELWQGKIRGDLHVGLDDPNVAPVTLKVSYALPF